MRNLVIDPEQCYCCCGALSDKTSTRCQKCRARLGWYRRKAWRVKSARRWPEPTVTLAREGVITR